MRIGTALLVLSLMTARTAGGQGTADIRAHPEIRADVVAIGNRVAVQAGGGMTVPFGYYTRVAVIGAAGADLGRFEQDASGRVDVIGRFLFDPFRQTRWGVSGGGGVSVRARTREGVRPFLVAVIDVEGRRMQRGVSPAFQLGVGGGVRVGAALRWGSSTAR